MIKTTFLSTAKACESLNMSKKRFTYAARSIGLEPIAFQTRNTVKHFWLYLDVQNSAEALHLAGRRAGKKHNVKPRILIKKVNLSKT